MIAQEDYTTTRQDTIKLLLIAKESIHIQNYWAERFLAVAMLIPSPGDGMRWCRRLADELRKCWIDNAMFVGFTLQDKQFVIANQSEVFVQPAAREQSSDL